MTTTTVIEQDGELYIYTPVSEAPTASQRFQRDIAGVVEAGWHKDGVYYLAKDLGPAIASNGVKCWLSVFSIGFSRDRIMALCFVNHDGSPSIMMIYPAYWRALERSPV